MVRTSSVVELAMMFLPFGMAACDEDFVEPNAFTVDEGPHDEAGQELDAVAEALAPADVWMPPPADASTPRPADGAMPPPADGAISTPSDAAPNPRDAECDLNGRWLVSQRVLATAIGQDQASHNWFYLEVRHEGTGLVVLKGLHCGYEVLPKTSLAAAVDSSGAWAAFLRHNGSAGRTGTFVKEGTNCHLQLSKEYVVRGATIPYYSNPATMMPGASDKAQGTTPGWEDWDADGNPGISLKVNSPLAKGTLYVAQRDWTQYDGATPLAAAKFRVSITYDSQQVALGRSMGSSSALESMSAPSSDATQHFAWFHKLDAMQAVGSDEQICTAVRMLKDTLAPEANQ